MKSKSSLLLFSLSKALCHVNLEKSSDNIILVQPCFLRSALKFMEFVSNLQNITKSFS